MRHLLPGTILLLTAALGAQPAPPFEAILKIDAHSHVFEDHPGFPALFRRLNFRTINICNSGTDGHLDQMHEIAVALYRQNPALYPFEATFDLLGRDDPAYAKNVIAWLQRMFERGAIGVKIWKDVGLEIKDRAGKYVLPDDPLFDPIYAFIAERRKPLHAHLAEPIDAWLPLDPGSPHYSYYSANPGWHLYGKPEFPSHAAIIAARDHLMEKHPALVVIGAHLGSLEHDLDGNAQRLDRYPNFHLDVSARTRNLTRYPSARVRAFFLKYQDRILYGLDQSWKPYREKAVTDAQRQAFLRRLEVRYRADYEYYAGQGEITYDNRKVEALGLPREVLEKFYHRNAERLFSLATARPGER